MSSWLWRHLPHSHSWRTEDAKRYCRLCGREEWVFVNPFPRVGEPSSYWKEVRL